jgi:hypothetical protein
MILREYMQRAQDLFLPVYTVCSGQELEVCQQVWEIVLDGLEVDWEMSDGYILEARFSSELQDEPKVVAITLNGTVGYFFRLKPSRTGPLKLAWVNSEVVVFEPITLRGGETGVQIEIRFMNRG